MKVYIVAPDLTIGTNESSKSFFKLLKSELSELVNVSIIEKWSRIDLIDPTREDSFIYFCRNDQKYSLKFQEKLKNFHLRRSKIYAIAMNDDFCQPADIAIPYMVYNVTKNLKVRQVTDSLSLLLTQDLARIIISRSHPNLVRNRLKIYLSQDDNEIINAGFRKINKKIIRDEISLQIVDDLRESDCMILFDNEALRKSNHLKEELKKTIKMQIPVLWVKIDENESKHNQMVIAPQDEYPWGLDPTCDPVLIIKNKNISSEDIESILVNALKLARRQTEHTLVTIKEFFGLNSVNNISIDWMDRDALIARMIIQKNDNQYFTRPIVHYIQFFGRHIDQSEYSKIYNSLKDQGGINFNRRAFDSMILLSPTNLGINKIDDFYEEDSFVQYLRFVEGCILKEKDSKKKVIEIWGAFSKVGPEYQNLLIRAYQSIREIAEINQCEIVFHEYSEINSDFLTLKRKEHTGQDEVVALICFGGKSQDCDREVLTGAIDQARQQGKSVFLLGSLGGQCATMACEMSVKGDFSRVNTYGIEFNNSLNESYKFREMTRRIIDLVR